jgi:hypothetical protein
MIRSEFFLTFQLSANRLADELRASIRAGDCVDFFKGLDRETDDGWLNLHRRTAHEKQSP